MALPRSLHKYVKFLEYSASAQNDGTPRKYHKNSYKANTENSLHQKIKELAGIGITSLYVSENACSWIGYIHSPPVAYPAQIGNIPCFRSDENCISLFTIKSRAAEKDSSIGIISSRYIKTLSGTCQKISEDAAKEIAGYISGNDREFNLSSLK
ncbi:hypothetical protein [Methanoplanus limicola]|uniref:Uncharacterized protein n=1 Tax=Methanoplanus limicola DSM 2279 TaxID=937775 RepID=H1Z2V6_9EURY|nr:hypothetical protein [Methanoplanus limicola]EHQ34695.1 hypothetical protein Metlim_0561 [Methanoplanus limicola DSM 2279]